jgi:hypothetical protein
MPAGPMLPIESECVQRAIFRGVPDYLLNWVVARPGMELLNGQLGRAWPRLDLRTGLPWLLGRAAGPGGRAA